MKKKLIVLAIGVIPAMYGASGQWTPTGNASWNVNANWTPISTFPNGISDNATFANSALATATVGSSGVINILLGNLAYTGSTNTYNIAFTGGSTLTVVSTIILDSGVTAGQTIATPLTIGASGSIANNSAVTLTISQPISVNTLTYGGSANGTLLLSAVNAQSAGTTINAGTVSVSTDSNLGNGGAIITLNGGTLNTTASFSSSRNVTLGASNGTIKVTGAGVTTTLSGILSSTGSLTKTDTGTLVLTNTGNTYSGGTILSAGTVSISDNNQLGNTNAGAITFSGGTLAFTGTPTIPIGRSTSITTSGIIDTGGVTVTYNSNITGGASATLTKNSSGTLNIGGTCTYGGGTTINNGTFSIAAGGLISTTGAVTLNGGVFDISNDNANVTIGNLSGTNGQINTGARILTFGTSTGGPFSYAGTATGTSAGALRKVGTTQINFTASSTYPGTVQVQGGTFALTGNGNLSSSASVDITISGSATFDISGISAAGTTIANLSGTTGIVTLGAKALTYGTATSPVELDSTINGSGGSLVKQGTGNSQLTGTNTYTGGTTINA